MSHLSTCSPTTTTTMAVSLPLIPPPKKKPRINNTTISLDQLKLEDEYYCQRFKEYFKALVQFKIKHGHVHIHGNDDTKEFDPPPMTPNGRWNQLFPGKIPPPSLFRFSETLRRRLQEQGSNNSTDPSSLPEPLLTQGRILQLDCLGFPWKSPDHDNDKRGQDSRGETGWKQRYRELCQFHRKHGHCNVPSHSRRQGEGTAKGLYQWCRKQRDHYENLQTKFQWQAKCETAAEESNGVIPADLLAQYNAACCKVLLTPEHYVDLKRIDFELDKPIKPRQDKWEKQYQKLVQFHKQHGHTRVSVYTHHKDKTNNNNNNNNNDSLYTLAIWVKSQRRQNALLQRRQEEGKSPGTLKYMKQYEQRTKKLNALGFEWDASDYAVHSPAYHHNKKKQQQKNTNKHAALKRDKDEEHGCNEESSDSDDRDSGSDNDNDNNNYHNGNAGHDQFHRFYTNYYS